MPEHLVLHIAEGVHRILIKDSLQKIQTIFSPFEQLFHNEDDIIDALTEQYPELMIKVDNAVEYMTIVLKLNSSKFIVFHDYKDLDVSGSYEFILMEGEMRDNAYTVERFIRKDESCEKSTSVEKYYYKRKGRNHKPFNYLHYVFKNDFCMENVRFRDSAKKLSWYNYDKIVNWFICKKESLWLGYTVEFN